MSENECIKSLILEFKDWLSSNRSDLNRTLRKYAAVKYYLVTLSIGIMIFAGNGLIAESGGRLWNIITIALMVFLILISSQIALLSSGAKKLTTIRAINIETSESWFKNIYVVVGEDSWLLNDFYVAKTIKKSKRNQFELISFLKSMVLISDAIIDERRKD